MWVKFFFIFFLYLVVFTMIDYWIKHLQCKKMESGNSPKGKKDWRICFTLSPDDLSYVKDYTYQRILRYDSRYCLSRALYDAIRMLQKAAEEKIPDPTKQCKSFSERFSLCLNQSDWEWIQRYAAFQKQSTGGHYSKSRVMRDAIHLMREKHPIKSAIVRPEELRPQWESRLSLSVFSSK